MNWLQKICADPEAGQSILGLPALPLTPRGEWHIQPNQVQVRVEGGEIVGLYLTGRIVEYERGHEQTSIFFGRQDPPPRKIQKILRRHFVRG